MSVEFHKVREGYVIYDHSDTLIGFIKKYKKEYLIRIEELIPVNDIEEILVKIKELNK